MLSCSQFTSISSLISIHAFVCSHGRGFDRSLGCEYNNAVSCLPPSRSASNASNASTDFECCEDHWTQQSLSVCDRAVDLWDTDRPGYGLNGTGYGDFMFFGRAAATIVNHSQAVPRQPLFFYLATQVSHQPVQAPGSLSPNVAEADNTDRKTIELPADRKLRQHAAAAGPATGCDVTVTLW